MTRRNKRIKQKAAKTSGGGNTARRRRFPPETAEQYFALSKSAQGRWNGITHVVSKLRVGDAALWEISPEFDVDPRTVVRHAKTALSKLPNGRYAANPTDNLLRILVLPTNDGLREVAIHDSREASVLSNYWAAVEKY